MTGYKSKRAAAQDKLVVTDIDGHVVRNVRKPKKVALDRDAEIERLNEKIEFLARTNMLYSDWEHRNVKVTSDLIRKGIEEAKINTELRAEIAELKTQLAQPAQEPVAWKESDEVECPVCKNKGFPWPKCGHITYLERTPSQRPWVDLTDEEIKRLWIQYRAALPRYLCFAKALLAKSKEKNNG